MSLLQREITRTILNSAETTSKTSKVASDTQDFALVAADYFYVGFNGPFAARYFDLDTVNTSPSAVSVDYWDGNQYQAVSDVIDQTDGFTRSGFISWENSTNWSTSEQSGVDKKLYWVRISVSADLDAGTKLMSCVNRFSTDETLGGYYSILVEDTRWLPEGETSFVKKHIAAKDLIVNRLKERTLIQKESDIIDINAVSVAAAHACAYLILQESATTDDTQEIRNRAYKNFEDEIDQLRLNVDKDQDGVVDESEIHDFGSIEVRRR